ncbi:MAG: Gfo/Idh/MocA family oxidoreductase [Bacteroidetes bacterium]|nr:Gfo/Idh/MocA family oxidoreductase [Bacteroidota bacterium]
MTINRRKFLRTSGLLAGGSIVLPTIIPSCAFGSNDKITIGMIGTGSHGISWNLAAYLKLDECRVIAACDVDLSRMKKAKAIIDEKYEKKYCVIYDDFRELLERREIDAVQISTPDHWHVPISLLALKKGKDICCEKPTLTIPQGRLLSNSVAGSSRIFQSSLEDRSIAQYHRMAELVRNGRIGKLLKLRVGLPGAFSQEYYYSPDPAEQPVPKGFNYEMWLGPAPYAPYTPGRCHYNFRWINDYSGGSLADWGAHMIDNAQWINGTEKSGPVEVVGEGSAPESGIYDAFNKFKLTYTYQNGVILDVHSDFVEIYAEGTGGWLHVKDWRGTLQASSQEIFNSVIGDNEIRLYTDESEHANFLKCIRSRKEAYHPVEDMHRTATMAHIGNIAMILKRKLKWDPLKEEFPDDNEANSMLVRQEREPWSLKTLLA